MKVAQTQCADCTPEQKAKYDSVMKTFHDKFEPEYNEFVHKMTTKKQ